MATKKRQPAVSFLLAQTREIPAAQFKARCLEIMDEIERSGLEVTITKHRRPVVRVVPARSEEGLIGSLRGQISWQGDVISPIDEVWTADEDNVVRRSAPRRKAK